MGSPQGPLTPGTFMGRYWPEARTVVPLLVASGPWLVDMQPPIAAASRSAPTRRFMEGSPNRRKDAQEAANRATWKGRTDFQSVLCGRIENPPYGRAQRGTRGVFAFIPPSPTAISRPRPRRTFR